MTQTMTPGDSAVHAPLDDASKAVLFSGARTVRTFATTPVSDQELANIWELAKWPPTAVDVQPLRVLFVRSGPGRDRLLVHVNERNRPVVATAPAVALLAVDTRFHEHLPSIAPDRPELGQYFAADDAMRTDTAGFNAALQAGYFVIAVRAEGLAAGPMGGFDKPGVDSEFFPDGRFRSILLVNIGHPGENAFRDRRPRLDHREVLHFV